MERHAGRAAPHRSAPRGAELAQGTLQAVYALFLGLMLTALVGVAVYTFYPSPTRSLETQIEQLAQEQNEIQCPSQLQCKGTLTVAEQAKVKSLQVRMDDLRTEQQRLQQGWAQRTSMILVAVATALMAISLVRAEAVVLLSNGVLLSGLFTMVYGVGWTLASGGSMTRFWVLLVAVAITVALGYLRFVRGAHHARAVAVEAGASGAAAGAALTTGEAGELAARITDLEERLAAAAAWLATPRTPSAAPTASALDDAEPAAPLT